MNLPLRMTVLAAFALTTGPAVMAQTTVAQPEAAKPVKVEHVWVVFKTHFDLGYTDLAENVFARYRGPMMDHALAIIEQNRQQEPDKRFAWTVPGWPLYAQILGPQQDPERKTRIEQAIREGSLAVHALPMTLHTESFDYEDLVRRAGLFGRRCPPLRPAAAHRGQDDRRALSLLGVAHAAAAWRHPLPASGLQCGLAVPAVPHALPVGRARRLALSSATTGATTVRASTRPRAGRPKTTWP